MTDPYGRARASADWLRSHAVEAPDVVLVAGSGWQGVMDVWGPPTSAIEMREVREFPLPLAPGHESEIRVYELGGVRVMALLGRTHLYEGLGPGPVVHGVRTAAALGCRIAVLTNANGSLRPEWPPGTCVLVRDHLNLTGVSPLIGARFVDLTEAYSSRLRALALDVHPAFVEGTYAMLPGPHYETRAEGSMLARLGADVVGMSTALETIAAREAGMEVLALSMVTVTEGDGEIDPAEVVAIATAAAKELSAALAQIIAQASGSQQIGSGP